jgi:hypothetical protein
LCRDVKKGFLLFFQEGMQQAEEDCPTYFGPSKKNPGEAQNPSPLKHGWHDRNYILYSIMENNNKKKALL